VGREISTDVASGQIPPRRQKTVSIILGYLEKNVMNGAITNVFGILKELRAPSKIEDEGVQRRKSNIQP